VKRKNVVLQGQLRLEARYLAEDLLAELKPEREIVKAIAARFGCREQAARRLYNEAWRGLALAEAEGRAERRGRMERTLELLFQKAFTARQWAVCERIAKGLRALGGLDAPIKVEGLVPGARSGGAEEERTDAELDYYAEHGHWPEEAPKKAKVAPAVDPLERLH